MTVTIRRPWFREILQVARNLRATDWKELSVTRNLTDPARLATSAWCAKYRRMAYIDGEPVFVFGYTLVSPQCGQVWGFGTWRTAEIMRPVTKYILRTMIGDMLDGGLLVAQAFVHPENALSARWLRHLGWQPGASLAGIGSGGQELLLWVAVADDFDRYRRRSTAAAAA